MKTVFIYCLAALFFYAIFREINIIKTLFVIASFAAAYAVYRLPTKYLMAMKYPFILLSFAATGALIFFPAFRNRYPVDPLIIFISFYGIALFLITMAEKKNALLKEASALSALFFSMGINLFIIGNAVLIIPISLAIILFLFIQGKNSLIPFIGGYGLAAVITLLVRRVPIFDGVISITDIERYLILGTSLFFLIFTLVGFVKRAGAIKLAAFFGFIYVATDILMSLGFKLSAGLLYRPVTALIIVTPLLGILMKQDGERA